MKYKFTFFALITLLGLNVIFAQAPAVSPVNGATGVAQTTTSFTWTDLPVGANANRYDFEIYTDAGYTTLLEAGQYNIVGTSATIATALAYNTTYYWQVRDTDSDDNGVDDGAGDNGAWVQFSFTTLLATPVLSNVPPTPQDHDWGVSLTPTFNWSLDASTSNVQYYFDLSTDNFTTYTSSAPLASPTYTISSALLNNKLYYWRVRAVVTAGPPNAGETTTSPVRDFITLLGTPTLSAPANNSVNLPLNITFTWSQPPDDNFTDYYIDYDNTGTFASPTTLGPVSSPTSSIAATLPSYYTQYYWRVRAVATGSIPPRHNSGLETKTSSTFNFWTKLASPTLSAPANYSVGISIVPTFTWVADPNAETYDIDIATDAGFTSIVSSATGLLTNTYTVSFSSALTNSSTYYWRVRASRVSSPGGPSTSDWSAWQFTTVTPAMPYLSNPANGSTIVGTTIYFTWYTLVTGVKFDLQYSTDSSFPVGPNTFTVSNITNTYQSVSTIGLQVGTQYYWRVISKTLSGVIVNFSSTWSFYTPGFPTPYLSYPTGGVTIYTNPATLYWYIGTYYPGIQYQVRYRTSTGTYPVTPQITTSNLYATLPSLTAGITYYWQVRSGDGTTWSSSWSSEESFVVYGSLTFITPYLSYPTGGTTVYFNPPTFYWYTGVYAPGLQFKLQYKASDNDFSTGATTVSGIAGTYYTPTSSLTTGITYYWRVAASFDGVTYGSYSSTESFTIASSVLGGAPVPTPSYPTFGTTIFTLTPTFTWSAYSTNSLEYQVIYSSNPTLSGGVLSVGAVSSGWLTSSSFAINPLTPLTAGATYYWQVRSRLASNNSIVSGYSTVAYFTTSAGASAVVPLIGSPNYGQPIQSSSAVLSWIIPTKSTSQLTYELQLAKNSDMSNAITVSDIQKNYQQVSGLELGKTYYWRVLSKTDKGEKSSYSAVGDFKTGNVTDVPAEQAIPTQFELSQNYPNPFNPTTIITYSLPQNSYVSIKIYDMLGREVKTLVNGEAVAGKHSMEWNGDDNNGNKVSSGVYLYRITATAQAGNFVSTRKMMLIK